MSLSDKSLLSSVSWSMKLRRFRGATFQSKAFVFSLLLLHCVVENLILKLFLYVWQCCMGVLIFPKVYPCAGSKGLFSLCYVLLSPCVPLYLMSASQITWKLFHIQSPKASTADKPAPFLMFRATPSDQAGDGNYNLLQSPLSGRDKM